MDIQMLHYFLAVYETMSFSKAARDCYVTQPVISRKISALEEEFRCMLFRRTSQGVIPTEAGKQFEQFAQQIVALYDEAKMELPLLSQNREHTLSVAAVTSMADGVLPRIIAEFYRDQPDTDILLDRYTPGEIDKMLSSGNYQYDLYITLLEDLMDRPALFCAEIMHGGANLLTRTEDAPTNDRAAAELLNKSTVFIVPQRDSPRFYRMAMEQLRILNVQPPTIRELRPVEMHGYCVSAGMGVAITPPMDNGLTDSLQVYCFNEGPSIAMGVAWHENKPLVKAFLKALHEVLPNAC